MKRRHVFILLVIIFFGGYTLLEFTSALNPYVGIAKAKASTASVQVKGELSKNKDSIYYDQQKQLHFILYDETGNHMNVVYSGTVPENFTHAKNIVIIGKMNNGVFQASKVLAKCPTKYQKGK